MPLDDDVFSAANGHDAQPLGRDFGGNEPHAGDALLGGERDAQRVPELVRYGGHGEGLPGEGQRVRQAEHGDGGGDVDDAVEGGASLELGAGGRDGLVGPGELLVSEAVEETHLGAVGVEQGGLLRLLFFLLLLLPGRDAAPELGEQGLALGHEGVRLEPVAHGGDGGLGEIGEGQALQGNVHVCHFVRGLFGTQGPDVVFKLSV